MIHAVKIESRKTGMVRTTLFNDDAVISSWEDVIGTTFPLPVGIPVVSYRDHPWWRFWA